MSATVRGYKLGEINAAGAATAEFSLVGHPPLQQLVNMQDLERRTMDARPGMYIKYFPFRYDAVTSDLKIGGGYLFDSRQNAEGYSDWATNEFEVDEPGEPPKKAKFWSRSIFKDVQRRTWDVVGACNFTLPDQHAVVRFQRWSYTDTAGDDSAIPLLKQSYEIIRETARKRRGAGTVWVLIRPEDRLIGMVTTVAKVADGNESTEAGNMSIAELERQPSLGAHLPPQLGAVEVYDRTSLMLTIWMPTSRLAGGVHQTTPNFPLLPTVTNLL